VSPPATRPLPRVERRGRRTHIDGGEGVAAAIGSQRQRAVVVFILVIGIAELHVVEVAGAPPAGRVSVRLDVVERGGRARRRSSLRGEVAAALRRWAGDGGGAEEVEQEMEATARPMPWGWWRE
jgi:hypothetical protein